MQRSRNLLRAPSTRVGCGVVAIRTALQLDESGFMVANCNSDQCAGTRLRQDKKEGRAFCVSVFVRQRQIPFAVVRLRITIST
jgi:hypothetical protein